MKLQPLFKGATVRTLAAISLATIFSASTVHAANQVYTLAKEPYVYGNVKFGGGGWVSGLQRSPSKQVYAQTDVGGVYRIGTDRSNIQWYSVTDKFGYAAQQPASIAFDPRVGKEKMVYIAYGPIGDKGNSNGMLISSDDGKTFIDTSISSDGIDGLRVDISGNGEFKNTGVKMAVTSAGRFYIAAGGLFTTSDPLKQPKWDRVASLDALLGISTTNAATVKQLTFVQIATINNVETIFVGVKGARTVGKSGIYKSTNGGQTWTQLNAPVYTTTHIANLPLATGVTAAQTLTKLNTETYPYRVKATERGTIYVTVQAGSGNYGGVWRLPVGSNTFVDISPMNSEYTRFARYLKLTPFGGLEVLQGATEAQDSVLASTANQAGPQKRIGGTQAGGENIYMSISGGKVWRPQFADASANGWNIGCDYTSCLEDNPNMNSWAEVSGKIHKSGNLIVDPLDHKRIFIGSGDGVWSTANAFWNRTFTPPVADQGADVGRKAQNSRWRFESNRIEELVTLGFRFGVNNRKLNLGFDYGMFYWQDTNQWAVRVKEAPGYNSDLDVAADNRKIQMRSTGPQLLISINNSDSWTTLEIPQRALSEKAGALKVTTNVDQVVLTKDGARAFIQQVGRWIKLSSKGKDSVFATDTRLLYSDISATGTVSAWKVASFPATTAENTGALDLRDMQLVVDLGDANYVYGFHRSTGALYRSTNKGASFAHLSIAGRMIGDGAKMFYDETTYKGINFRAKSVFASGRATSPLVAVPGRTGELWINFNSDLSYGGVAAGLWRITGAHTTAMQLDWKGSVGTKYDVRGRRFKGIFGGTIAMGAPKVAGGYPALYIYGAGIVSQFDPVAYTYDYTYGFFRSDDAGANWVDISDTQKRNFGGLGNSGQIYASPFKFGEIYHGTPGRGVVYAMAPVSSVNTAPTIQMYSGWLNTTDRTAGFRLYANRITDAESNVKQVDYYVNDVKVGSSTTAPQYAFNYPNVVLGSTYKVKAVAIDAGGLSGSSEFNLNIGLADFSVPTPNVELYVNMTKPASAALVDFTVRVTDANGNTKGPSASYTLTATSSATKWKVGTKLGNRISGVWNVSLYYKGKPIASKSGISF